MKMSKTEERSIPAQIPESSPRLVKIDGSLERLSWLMDDLIRVPGLGWRFGLDALIG